MNLIEARKLAHEGWVRSPTRTGEYWHRVRSGSDGELYLLDDAEQGYPLKKEDIDVEDWEPKPAPKEPFEAEVWINARGGIDTSIPLDCGWRKIRVREVME